MKADELEITLELPKRVIDIVGEGFIDVGNVMEMFIGDKEPDDLNSWTIFMTGDLYLRREEGEVLECMSIGGLQLLIRSKSRMLEFTPMQRVYIGIRRLDSS